MSAVALGGAVIAEAGRSNTDCKVVRVDVVGLADYRGTPNANLDLSRKRALAVATSGILYDSTHYAPFRAFFEAVHRADAQPLVLRKKDGR